ncbi:MAG: hypothetical protein JJ858_15220 [Rhizobiaceae bacterium]|nr:hypothetical protein [Rhizobiaceae bacterium]
MNYSNATITPSDHTETATISFLALWRELTSIFHYSAEDRFAEAQEAADQLEAAQNMPTLEEMQKMNRAELVEATRGIRKFDFWV